MARSLLGKGQQSELIVMSKLSIAVAIATTGRPEVVQEALEDLRHQTRPYDELMVCPAKDGDVYEDKIEALGGKIVRGKRGLTCQRNTILRELKSDIVLFLDDDFFLAPDYLEKLEQVYLAQPDAVMITGEVVEDGILGPGLTIEEAKKAVADLPPVADRLSDVYNGYGCNMSFRMAPVREHDIMFDETLPLYGWQEDVDFSNRLLSKGDLVETNAFVGVHRGTKRSRSPGKKLGYSQVANPLYLVKKGSMSRGRAYKLMIKNLIANHVKIMTPEPWVDRAGRANGNWHALFDLVRGKMDPQKINSL